MGRGLALELEQEFAAENIKCFVLARMGVRRGARTRRNHGFPE
jgi:hypothetical protein